MGLSLGVLGSLGRLGRVLGLWEGFGTRLGRVLGPLWAILGPLGSVLGRSWSLLGGLGQLLGPRLSGRPQIDHNINLELDLKTVRIATEKHDSDTMPVDVSAFFQS